MAEMAELPVAGPERHADDTGHLHRCARVNGVWVCAAGCAIQRAEQAEARVAALSEELARLTDDPHEVYIGSRKIQLLTTMDPARYDQIRALLAPPTAGA